MQSLTPDLHDRKILGARHHPQQEALELFLNGGTLHLTGIIAFLLTTFTEQNIILDIYTCPARQAPQNWLAEYPWLEDFTDDAYRFIFIVPSAGCIGTLVQKNSGGTEYADD
ncbi:hypothetical protein [Neisseria bacilliformis]|uniref:hypothetical protein n=1 Tax=Neisseria bacilliformis TaxID=267212 RepID=UPI0028ED23E0|nr:hypothetical protein [Neisseria bacilliformis]